MPDAINGRSSISYMLLAAPLAKLGRLDLY